MSKDFFLKSLNYSMANEDSQLERKIASEMESKIILSVCGSGSRAFPLIIESTEELDLIDMSKTQLDFAKLRQKSFEKFTYEDFKEFWGYEQLEPKLRKERFQNFIKETSFELEELFINENWSEPIYYGGWERTYQKLNKLVRIAVGNKRIDKLKNCKDLDQQLSIFHSFGFQVRWKAVLLVVGNRALFNSLLYKGKFVEKNIDQSYVQFYVQAFERLFNNKLLKDSYFLQMSFLGKIEFLSGVPIEARKGTFQKVKEGLKKTKVSYINQNIIEYLKESKKKYDFISISDVPSYFDYELGNKYLEIVKPNLKMGGVIVVRYYLKTHQPIETGYRDVTNEYQGLIDDEGVQMYQIKIYKKIED
ncbi:MAG: S-adenosylmethionine-diacylglycerol 3-amino-3-carboxypropyl transferase [Bacteriovoracaceae bacterium]|jgi:S-adenosylmethionine-diacylglycerol 3-amino-3-carboxypropyl transferase